MKILPINKMIYYLSIILTMVFLTLYGTNLTPVLAQDTIISSTIPSNTGAQNGDTITVAINIDMSGMNAPNDLLGSFTGSLDWDPTVLDFVSHTGLQQGFTGLVNTNNVGTGRLDFNGANASGVGGNFNVLEITFEVIGSGGATTTLDLEYSAMAAATTFINLIPFLTVMDGMITVSGPAMLNPPQNLRAEAGNGIVDLFWEAPLPSGVIEIAYDNGADDGIGFVDIGELAVRFTPNVYPSTLMAIRVWWFDADGEELNNVAYSVWIDPSGTDNGPISQVLGVTPHVVQSRNMFEDIDISGNGIVINSGDFYYSLIQPQDINYLIGLDSDGLNASRAWVSFDEGSNWLKLENLGFPYNVVIRALVLEGSGANASVVEIKPNVEPAKTLNLLGKKQLMKKYKHLFKFSQDQNAHPKNSNDSTKAGKREIQNLLSFNVYRSEDNVTFDNIASIDAIIFSFSDNTVTNDITYYYYVTAIYDEGESPPSDTVVATPTAIFEGIEIHQTQELLAGVTNEGTIGALNDFVSAGDPGFRWNGINHLFEGALMIGIPPNHVVDGARVISGGDQQTLDADFQFTDNLNVIDDNADSTLYATSFNDSRANQPPFADDGPNVPIGLDIQQTTYSYTDSENSGYVIFKLDISNNSDSQLENVLIGMYLDWDIFDFSTNTGEVVIESVEIPGINNGQPFEAEFAYLFDRNNQTAFMGAVPLSQNFFRAARIADNNQEIFPGGFSPLSEANKYRYMLELRENDPRGDPFGLNDKSLVVGLGGGLDGQAIPDSGFTIPVGQSITVGIAVLGGNDPDDFIENGKAAMKKWVELGNEIIIFDFATDIENNEVQQQPEEFSLEQNYPNPFNATTIIQYALPKANNVTLRIYNVLGQEVRTILNSKAQVAGQYKVPWDGKDNLGQSMASGIYIYELHASDFIKSRKLILLK